MPPSERRESVAPVALALAPFFAEQAALLDTPEARRGSGLPRSAGAARAD